MKKNILILFLFIIQTATFSQNWEWGIKATGNHQSPYDSNTEIAVDGEGNFVFAGYYQLGLSFDTLSIYTGDDYYADMYLCRIDSSHNVQWLKHIETGNVYGDEIGLCLDDDKNIYLTGRKNDAAFVAKYSSLGNLIWETELGDTSLINFSGYGHSIGTDMYDNVYVTGGSGSAMFFTKLNYNGSIAWYKEIEAENGYTNGCYGNDIVVDKFGNMYFTGVFENTSISFDDITLHNTMSWGELTFWGKIDTNGNFIWAKQSYGGRTNSKPQIALTADDKLYLCGVYYYYITLDGITIDFCSYTDDPKPYIAKYDTDGNILWAKLGNMYYGFKGYTKDIKTDFAGNLYLTGCYSTGTYRYNDYYIEKYNSIGESQWKKEFITYQDDYSHSIDIDNNGFCYNVGYNKSANFIDTASLVSIRTVGIGQLNTQSSTYKKTPRPKINRTLNLCQSDTVVLFAEGQQIKWYDNPDLSNLIFEGNEFEIEIKKSNKLYATQTINGVESWPKEIIITLSELSFANIEISGDTIFALTETLNHNYEWFYNDELIPYENRYFYLPDTSGYYSVIISDGYCQKQLDTLFEKTVVDTLKEAEVLLYPNPTNQKATIIIKSELNNELELTLISYNGRTYFRKKIYKEGLYFNYNIDLSLYPTGIYLLNVSGNNLNITKKLIRN